MRFFSELKRRNLFRISGVYAIVGWLLLQVATALEDVMGLPEWFDAFVFALLLIGFPLAPIFAWAFELTPEGLKRTADVDLRSSIAAQTGSRLDLFLVLGLFAFAAALLLPRFFPQLGSEAVSSPTGADSSTAGVTVSGVEASIAVLPPTCRRTRTRSSSPTACPRNCSTSSPSSTDSRSRGVRPLLPSRGATRTCRTSVACSTWAIS